MRNLKIALTIALAAILTACSPEAQDALGAQAKARMAPVSGEPLEGGDEIAFNPEYSVLRNYGFVANGFPLEFQAYQMGTTYRRIYHVHQSGSVNQVAALYEHDMNETTPEWISCIDFVTIDGTAEEGTITIDRAETAWAFDPNADRLDPWCPKRNGVYGYRATENGLEITFPNGTVETHAELISQ